MSHSDKSNASVRSDHEQQPLVTLETFQELLPPNPTDAPLASFSSYALAKLIALRNANITVAEGDSLKQMRSSHPTAFETFSLNEQNKYTYQREEGKPSLAMAGTDLDDILKEAWANSLIVAKGKMNFPLDTHRTNEGSTVEAYIKSHLEAPPSSALSSYRDQHIANVHESGFQSFVGCLGEQLIELLPGSHMLSHLTARDWTGGFPEKDNPLFVAYARDLSKALEIVIPLNTTTVQPSTSGV